MADYLIRRAEVADAAAACLLLRSSIAECCRSDKNYCATDADAWLANKTPAIVRSWFAWPENVSVVAVAGTSIIGVGMLCSPRKIALLHVCPRHWRSGIGSAMLHWLAMHAEGANTGTIRAIVPPGAHEFFIRYSYQVKGGQRAPYGDAFLMTKPSLSRRYPRAKCGHLRCGNETTLQPDAAESVEESSSSEGHA
jgi:GNAT superfamily N-acetyltransferase